MKKNIGNIDRILRLTAAAIIAILFATGIIYGTAGIVLVVVAAVLLFTSLVNFCPLYKLLGLKTSSVKN